MATKDEENKVAGKDVPPQSSRMIVEGEPVSREGAGNSVPLEEQNLNPSALARAQGVKLAADGGDNPAPDAKEIVKFAGDKLKKAADDAGFSDDGAKTLLHATDAEALWTPDNEKLSVYANKLARHTFEDRGRGNDGSGTSDNAPDSPDKKALAGSKK